MSKLQRTPPSESKLTGNNLNQTRSEPDISSAVTMGDCVNTTRSKRRRNDNSPKAGFVPGSQELQLMFAAWKRDQDSSVTTMLSEQAAVMDKLVSELADIKKQNNQIQATNVQIRNSNADIVQSISFINKQFEELKKEVEVLRKERKEQNIYIESLEKKIQDLQYKSRSSGTEIRNIPFHETESSDCLIKVVCRIGSTVGVPLIESDLRDIYRLPGKSSYSSSPRPIIAEFKDVLTKQRLLNAVRLYNKNKAILKDKLNTEVVGFQGERIPVYVTEQLPPSHKKLFYKAREYAKNNGFQYCWTANGNIFLRKQEGDKLIKIISEKCLLSLCNGGS